MIAQLDTSAYAVVERQIVDEDEIFTSKLFVTQVPKSIERMHAKEMVDKSGKMNWPEGKPWLNHSLLAFERWPDNIISEYRSRAAEIAFTYDELESEAKGEKRVTLRLEKGLHARAVQRAVEINLSFHDYCLAVLEWAVDELNSELLRPRQDLSRIAQRDAMRALYQICRGDKALCVDGWIRLYKADVVAVGKHPERYPPESYGPTLWKDGQNKKWLTDKVSDETLKFVRGFLV